MTCLASSPCVWFTVKIHSPQYYYHFQLPRAEISILRHRSSMQRRTEIRSFMKFAIFSLSTHLHWLQLLLGFVGFFKGRERKKRSTNILKGMLHHAATLCSTLSTWQTCPSTTACINSIISFCYSVRRALLHRRLHVFHVRSSVLFDWSTWSGHVHRWKVWLI